jgi:uncharacterized protein YkwD
MKAQTIFSILFAIFAISCFSESNKNVFEEKIENEIVALVNQHRKSKGLNPFVISDVINQEAKIHSSNMASRRVRFGNDGFNRRTSAIKDEIGGQSFSENVAYGHTSALTAFKSWLNSANHKKNIEGDFTHIGVGVSQASNGTLYFTQIFVKIDPNAILVLTDEIAQRLELEIVELVNRHRATLGLRPLTISKAITAPSKVHSQNMAAGRVGFSHTGFDYRTAEIRKAIGGVGFAENLAYGQTTAASVVDSWLKSPGHRKNIEGDFTHIGIGIAQSKDKTLYYTQIFAKIRQ